MVKFKALYPTDAKNYNAILEDGTFVRLLWKGSPDKYEVWAIPVEDKRPAPEAASFGDMPVTTKFSDR